MSEKQTLTLEPTLPQTKRNSAGVPTQISAHPTHLHGTENAAFDTLNLKTTVPVQDLSSDKLLLAAPRVAATSGSLPSLSGIPLLAKLGQGGMGAVYLGYHLRLNKEVAVKVLPFNLAEQSPEVVKRFYREAQIAAKIQSPHLVNVYDVNEENGLFFLVMEFVDGASAADCLKASKASTGHGLSLENALDICIAACEGLAEAHAQSVVHRDVKPDNILIPKSASGELQYTRAKLADLGLARTESTDRSITASSAAMGTPGYMPPEQARSAHHAGPSADVFAMGATLYSLLTGRAPFKGESAMDVLLATMQEKHPPIRSLRADVSPEIASLVDKCLAKSPDTRYANASVLLELLKECRNNLGHPAVTKVAVSKPLKSTRATPVSQHGTEQSRRRKPAGPHAPNSSRGAYAISGGMALLALASLFLFGGKKDSPVIAAASEMPAATHRTELKSATPAIPLETAIDLGGGSRIEMVLVKGGTFEMGANDGLPDEKPVHPVTISRDFYIGKYEITVAQFAKFVEEAQYKTDAEKIGASPSVSNGIWMFSVSGIYWKSPGFDQKPESPATLISWNDAQAFVEWASRKSKRPVRLPTEAEWEYAARGPQSYRFPWGNTWRESGANLADLTLRNSGFCMVFGSLNETDGFARTSPVGTFKNGVSWCGAYDLLGNVWEWVQDPHDAQYYWSSPAIDPPGSNSGTHRVYRGGSWVEGLSNSRTTIRAHYIPEYRTTSIGFRVALAVENPKP